MICLATLSLKAQDFQCDSGTCTVKHNGKYTVELAGCNNYLDIFVYDAYMRPLKGKVIDGTAEFFYLDETSLSSAFRQYFKTHSLRAKIPVAGFYNCKVTLTIHDEVIEVYFDNECDALPGRK